MTLNNHSNIKGSHNTKLSLDIGSQYSAYEWTSTKKIHHYCIRMVNISVMFSLRSEGSRSYQLLKKEHLITKKRKRKKKEKGLSKRGLTVLCATLHHLPFQAVRWACVPDLRRQRRWNHRLSGVSVCPLCHIQRQAGAKAEVGFLHVWSGWQWLHQQAGDAGNCYGKKSQSRGALLLRPNASFVYALKLLQSVSHCFC